MGQAGDQSPREARARREGPPPRFAAGFLGRGLKRDISDPIPQGNEDHRCKDQEDRHYYNHRKGQALCSPDDCSDLFVARRNEINRREICWVRSLIVICGSACDLIDILSALGKGHSCFRC